MKIFKVDAACAGQLKLEQSSLSWFCIISESGLVSFSIDSEVVFASGKIGEIIFDKVKDVDVESQTVTLAEYGLIEIKRWEYFARV